MAIKSHNPALILINTALHNARNRRIYGGGFFVPGFSAQKERRSKFRMVAIVIGTNVMHLKPPPHL
jgi:hypothetical protein